MLFWCPFLRLKAGAEEDANELIILEEAVNTPETPRVLERVADVNAALLADVPPITPGLANVAPPNKLAFRWVTTVLLLTTKGAVPSETVLINCPVTETLVPEATPRTGVTNVGLSDNTTLPVPVEVVVPVPPLATWSAVPESVIASVPEVVIGLPEILKNAGTDAATLVTVPVVGVVHDIGVPTPPPEVNTCPEVPAVVGKLKLYVPATAWGKIEILPDVEPDKTNVFAVISVNTALLATVPPIIPGLANVAPPNKLAFKLETNVVLDTDKGAVPVDTVLINCPVTETLVPEASPRTGVTKVGLVERTTLPEPVEVVVPVPPLATGRAVPESVIASVPFDVRGPSTDKNVGTDKAILEIGVYHVIAELEPPVEVNT